MNEEGYRFADLALARRLEGKDAAGCMLISKAHGKHYPSSDSAAIAVAGGWAAFTGPHSPITQAFALGLHGPVSDDEMDTLEEFFRSRGASVFIEVCPLADASLLRHLGERGYRPLEFSNVLVRPLGAEDRMPQLPDGITVREPREDEAELLADTIIRGFIEEGEPPAVLSEIFIASARDRTATSLLAEVNGVPAGGCTMRIHDGIAGMDGASTLPQFRRRGIQTALVQTRLAMAAAAGCEFAMAVTLPGSASQRNMERRGYRVVYTRCKFVREWS